MLRPVDTSCRERKNLNGLWAFRLDTEGVGAAAKWQTDRLPDARQMAVPASFNDLMTDRAHCGACGAACVVLSAAGMLLIARDEKSPDAEVLAPESPTAAVEGVEMTPEDADAPAEADLEVTGEDHAHDQSGADGEPDGCAIVMLTVTHDYPAFFSLLITQNYHS